MSFSKPLFCCHWLETKKSKQKAWTVCKTNSQTSCEIRSSQWTQTKILTRQMKQTELSCKMRIRSHAPSHKEESITQSAISNSNFRFFFSISGSIPMFLGYKLTLYCVKPITRKLSLALYLYRNRESGNKMLNTPTHSRALKSEANPSSKN